MCVFFQVEAPVSLGSSAWGVLSADLNADGFADAVVALPNSNQIEVLSSDGKGGFAKTATFAAGNGPTALALGNVFGAGASDVVVANSAAGKINVLKNTGNGSFAAPVSYALGSGTQPTALTLTDLNGDGKADIVVAEAGSNAVAVLLNNGSGGFAGPVTYAAGAAPSAVVADVLDGSKRASLIVADGGSNQITVLPQAGGGAFGAAKTYTVGQNPTALATGDFYGTGWQSVAVAAKDGSITLFANTGNGGLTAQGTLTVAGSASCITAADINADGLPDLIVGSSNGGAYQVSIFVNTGTGSFFQPPLVYALPSAPVALAVGNTTADGRANILVTLANGSIDELVHAPDSYAWSNPAGGDWGTASNWTDTVTNQPATVAPGATNAVTLAGSDPWSFLSITGSGAAASLAVSGNVLLLGSVAVGGAVTAGESADFELDGGTLTASGLVLNRYGWLEVTSASSATVSGSAALAGGSALFAAGGSTLRLGALASSDVFNYSSYGPGAGILIATDDSSAIEIGATGGAAAGAVTVDKGAVAALFGTIDGNVVLNGTLAVTGGGTLSIDGTGDPFGTATSLSGSGTLSLTEGSKAILGVASSAAVQFLGPYATLDLEQSLASGLISGFDARSTLQLAAGLASSVSYKQTSATLATLTFKKGSSTVGTLALAGNYTGSVFHLSLGARGAAYVTVQTPGTGYIQPGTLTGSIGADYLYATAANQTLTGLGGGDSLDARGYSGLVFKDTTANLNGAWITNGNTSDVIDLTDLSTATATVTLTPGSYYTPTTLSVADGTRSAVISLGDTLPVGYFTASADGSGGTKLTFNVIQTAATADNQVLTGLGIAHTLDANGHSGVVFKDTSAHLNGTTLYGINSTETIDVTDLNLASVTSGFNVYTYPYQLKVGDGAHNATIGISFSGGSSQGAFIATSDGAGGTDFSFRSVVSSATADNQTLYGLGVVSALYGNGHNGIVFQDTAANLNGETLYGFAASDVIDLTNISAAKATVSLSGGGYYNGYTLVVNDGVRSASMSIYAASGSLPLGYFAASADGGGGTNLSFIKVNADAYSFNAAYGGAWGTTGNWQDTTTGAAATTPPSYGNAVSLAQQGSGFTAVTGKGNAASLTTSGNVLLLGSVALGSLVAGVSGNLTVQSGILALDAGASISAAGILSVAAGGTMEVGGGSTLAVARIGTGGYYSYGSAKVLAVVGGSMLTTSGFGYYDQFGIWVDANSALEVGNAGNAAKGALTVDAGVTASLSGSVAANLVVNGRLRFQGSTVTGFAAAPGVVSGSGTVELTSYQSVSFSGAVSAALLLDGSNTVTFGTILPTGTISGFDSTSALVFNTPLTGLSYSQGSGIGTLTLTNAGKSVGSITLAGSYSAGQFLLTPAAGDGSARISYLPTPSKIIGNQISTSTDAYTWSNSSGGDWSYGANWLDNGSLATVAPGSGNAVNFSSGNLIVSGIGSAASLTVQSASIAFTGAISVAGSLSNTGTITLGAGAALSAGTLGGGGVYEVIGGSLTSSGTGTLTGVVNVLGGGTLTAASLTLAGTLTVDSLSAMEIGTAGGAKSGGLTVDAGATLNAGVASYYAYYSAPATIFGNLTVNGTLAATGFAPNYYYSPSGVLDVVTLKSFPGASGTIAGSGTIAVSGADLILAEASSVAIALSNLTGQIYAGTQTLNPILELAGPIPTGTISGFTFGDVIQVDQSITGISFTQTSTTAGKLTLSRGSTTVGTLALAGNFANAMFHLDVAPATGYASITLQAASGAAGTSPVSTGKDAYAWTGASGAVWSTAANWTDTTTNTKPTAAPGAGNAVTIAGVGSGYTVVGGNGAAASLTTSGHVLFTGTIADSGALSVTAATSASLSSALALDGAKLTATMAQIGGLLEAERGASATFSGLSTLVGSGSPTVVGGSLMALGGSTLVFAGGLANANLSSVIAIDSTSQIKIGAPLNPIGGGLTVAAVPAALAGAIYGNVAVNGTLAVPGGASLAIDMAGTVALAPYGTPSIGGSGTLLISEGATLSLGAAAFTANIVFGGPNATLAVTALPSSLISGFVAGDSLVIDAPVTGLSYAQTTATQATLTLTNGGAAVGTLKLAGNYAGQTFHLDVQAGGAAAVISVQTVGAAAVAPTLITGTVATDALVATANNQTFTGLGGGDTFNGNAFTGLTFKDLTANFVGDAISNFATSDVLDFTDMTAAKASVSYSGGALTVNDGTHSATFRLGFLSTPTSGGFTAASDGALGTKVSWH